MPVQARAISAALILLILLVSCGESQQETVYLPPTATLQPPASAPAPAAATATGPSTPPPTATPANTSTPPPAATPANTSTPLPTQTSTPMPTETWTATPTLAPPPIPFPNHPPELGDTLTRPIDGMGMVYVPGGTFEMGSLPDTDQFGPHPVTLDGFWIEQTQVTNAQFAAFLNDQGNQVEDGYTWMEVEQMANCQVEWFGGIFRPEAGKETHHGLAHGSRWLRCICEADSDKRKWDGYSSRGGNWECHARHRPSLVHRFAPGRTFCHSVQICGRMRACVGILFDGRAEQSAAP